MVQPSRKQLLQELGASINFINLRQFDTKQFELNGLYRKGVGVTGSDGVFPYSV
jgi:hypothetical protein